MRLVLQRVKQASVTVNEKVVGAIDSGWVVFVGLCPEDDLKDVDIAVDKTVYLRMFPDDDGKFNQSVIDTKGSILVVSQFTLYGDCRKGRRPSFSRAARPEQAEQLYNCYVDSLRKASGLRVATGEFQAHMDVSLVNDGPVTLLVDTKRLF